MYHYFLEKIQECDIEIEKYVQNICHIDEGKQKTFDFVKTYEHRPRKRRGSKNAPCFEVKDYIMDLTGVDLILVPGLSDNLALTIISEIGLDMKKWKSSKHFSSWLGLSPKANISGGKKLGDTTAKVQNRASESFRIAASALKNSKSYLGHFFRRIAFKHGFPKAVTATARKIAVIVYTMLKNQVPFKEQGADFYIKKNRDKEIFKLKRKAQHLGLEIIQKH